jgi:UDP-glucose 4-epimerase
MNVLLTGGAGYIGSITAAMLLDHGHRVTVFDNLERGHRAALDRRARFIRGDLRKADDIQKAMARTRPDAVMHFAAYALVGESMEKPEDYFTNNVKGGLHLIEAMREQGVRTIVFSSTCATYGQPSTRRITEQTSQAPTNPYGESKLMLEKMLLWYERLHGFRPVFLRYFNACGAAGRLGEDHDPETHLIPNILKVALGQSRAVRVFGDDYPTPDGTCIRDYIHVSDLALAHRLALEKNATGAFNLGTGQGCSVRQVLDTARAVTGRRIPERLMPRRPGDPARLVASAGKAESVLGWKPVNSRLDTILETAWRWHRDHPRGYAGR